MPSPSLANACAITYNCDVSMEKDLVKGLCVDHHQLHWGWKT